jgi:nicotinate-nucleotide adenylyltransferase
VEPEKIGILGGTFDPVHFGHLLLAQDAMEALGLDRVIFVPASMPPHKMEKETTSAPDRYEMVRLALEDNSLFSLSDVEFKRSGPSFSVDTITRIKEEIGDGDLYFLIGADNLDEIWTWKDPKRLFQICRVVVIGRAGLEVESKQINLPGPVMYLDLLRINLSSSEIRSRIKKDQSIRYLVPQNVERYIYEKQLYR